MSERPDPVGFARAVLRSLWEGHDIDGADIQDLGLKHRLIAETTFDPKRHADNAGVCPDKGDQWFEETAAFKALTSS